MRSISLFIYFTWDSGNCFSKIILLISGKNFDDQLTLLVICMIGSFLGNCIWFISASMLNFRWLHWCIIARISILMCLLYVSWTMHLIFSHGYILDFIKHLIYIFFQFIMAEDDKDVKSFKDLGICEQLVEACVNLGWKTPSKIQAEAIPHALEGLFSFLIFYYAVSYLHLLRLLRK